AKTPACRASLRVVPLSSSVLGGGVFQAAFSQRLLREFSSMPPLPAHDKFTNSLPASRSFFSTLQRLRQGSRIAGISDGHCRNRLPALRDVVRLLGCFRIESRHLVNNQPSCGGFDRKLQARRAHVVLRITLRCVVLRYRVLRP